MQDVTPRGQRRLVGREQHRAAALGPIIEPDDFMHLACFYCFEDVDAGTAPIRMVPNGRPDHECVPMIVPGGSVCLYSIYTRHAASDFTASSGHRPVMWVGFTHTATCANCHPPRKQDSPCRPAHRSGASTGRSVVMMAKIPSASRAGTERVIIQISPPPASKYGGVQMPAFAASGILIHSCAAML